MIDWPGLTKRRRSKSRHFCKIPQSGATLELKNALRKSGTITGVLNLEEIIGAYAGMVRRMATVYERYPDRVDDLVQEVWLAVWQALPRLNDPANLKPYVARIAQNMNSCRSIFTFIRPAQSVSEAEIRPNQFRFAWMKA